MPHRKTCQRFNDPGHAHCLTFSCYRRQPFLTKDRSWLWLVDAIDKAPEHVHLLIWPTQPDYDIGGILNSIKQSVAKRAVTFVRREAAAFLSRMADRQPSGEVHYRFWQRGGGYDRNVVEAATVHRLVEYLHGNPVRRGLCARPEDWHWSSAADFAGVRVGPLRLDRDSLPGIVCADEGKRLARPRLPVNVPTWPLKIGDGP